MKTEREARRAYRAAWENAKRQEARVRELVKLRLDEERKAKGSER